MNERQAASGSDGAEPDAARTPDEDKGFELPPPPAPGALWASAPAAGAAGGRASVQGSEAAPGQPADRFSGSTRPISAMPSAGAARATVPGALTVDAAGLRALTWPTGGSKIYGGPAGKAGDAAPPLSRPDRPEPDEPEPDQPEPDEPEPSQPEPGQPEPGQPRPSPPRPGEPSRPAEPFKPFDPPAPVEPPPGPFPTPAPGPGPSPTPPGPSPIPPGPGPSPVPPGPGPSPVPPGPGPSPVPPGPGPSPVPPGPGPSPVPPGPGPSPVPPGPGPSPVPGPPQPVFPPPPMIRSPAGLPAYTMPPVSPQPPTGGAAPREHQTPGRQHAQNEQQSAQPSWNQPSASPYGVGSPGAVRQPFGGPAAQVSTPPARHPTYGQSGPAVPGQRGEGTVYGAQNPAEMTMPVTMNAIDNSGSLTGHILAQGWDRGEDTGRRSNVKVGIAMLVVLLFLVGMSLLFLFTAGDAFTDMVNGVFNKD